MKKIKSNEKIRMTKEGYDEQLRILENLKKEFANNEKAMTLAYKASSGDGAHDNGEFETLLNKERLLVSQIESQQEKILSIEIIEVEDLEDDMVNIGDTVSIDMCFSNGDIEPMIITLIGADGVYDENKISINSPVGKAIYKHKVGETVSYKVNNNKIVVKINEKYNSMEQAKDHVRTK